MTERRRRRLDSPDARPAADTWPLSAALGRSDELSSLLQRVVDSKARLQAVTALLPPTLVPTIRAGPLDATTWTVLVGDPSAAAKLRQLMPTLRSTLLAAGWPPVEIRVKVLPRS